MELEYGNTYDAKLNTFPNGTIFKLDLDYMMNISERTNILDIESRIATILTDINYKEFTDKLLHQYPEQTLNIISGLYDDRSSDRLGDFTMRLFII